MANIENKDPKIDIKKRVVKALFSYTPINPDELQLKVNDILEVIEETEEGWWRGTLNGNTGVFPSNFVVELDGHQEELNNKLVSELSPFKNIAKAKNITNQESMNKTGGTIMSNKQDSKQILNNSASGDGVDGLTSSKNSTDSQAEKKSTSSKKPSVDSSAPRLPPKPIREQACVIFPYDSQNEDELTLKEGDIIIVLSKDIEDKGWWRGELNNKIGVFPDNFVKLLKAEEQKKPERPDKPATVLAAKNSLRSISAEKAPSDSSPKLDRKAIKTPPAKPPPPEIHRKEPERPLPPCPKKPQPTPLQTVKKPNRSSMGPKIPSSQPQTLISARSAPSDSNPSTSSALTSSEKTETNAISSDLASEKDNKDSKKELEFDAVEPSGKKLVHLTASRAKAPNRRPPSFIFLKDSEKESSTVVDSRRLSEPLLNEIKTILPLTDSEKILSMSASTNEIKPKAPPSRPSFPSGKISAPNKSDVTNSPKKDTTESTVKSYDTVKKEVLSEKVPMPAKEVLQPKPLDPTPQIMPKLSPSKNSKTPSSIGVRVFPSMPPAMPCNASAPADPPFSSSVGVRVFPSAMPGAPIESVPTSPLRDSGHSSTKLPAEVTVNGIPTLEAQIVEIKDDVKALMTTIVNKNDYAELSKQVNELKELLETYNASCSRAISDLKEELDQERRLRHNVEKELLAIKKGQNT